MCWSAEVSLETFLFSFGVCIFAYVFGFNSKLLFLYFWFFLMQLIEFFLWRNIDNDYWNRFFSLMAFSILTIHPLAMTLIVSNPVVRMWFLGLYAIYVSLLLYVHFSERDKIDYSASVAKNGHLTWNWVKNYKEIYFIYLFFFATLIVEKEYIVFFVLFLTYSYSFINYRQEKTFSSMWCWSANVIGLLIIMRVLYNIRSRTRK
jgi:hypothetical protein